MSEAATDSPCSGGRFRVDQLHDTSAERILLTIYGDLEKPSSPFRESPDVPLGHLKLVWGGGAWGRGCSRQYVIWRAADLAYVRSLNRTEVTVV